MRQHTGHHILGLYCWTCQIRTSASIPGWPRSDRAGDGPRVKHEINSVQWQDGSRDMRKGDDVSGGADRGNCIMCHSFTCNKPVHIERYKEIKARLN